VPPRVAARSDGRADDGRQTDGGRDGSPSVARQRQTKGCGGRQPGGGRGGETVLSLAVTGVSVSDRRSVLNLNLNLGRGVSGNGSVQVQGQATFDSMQRSIIALYFYTLPSLTHYV